MLQQVVTSVRNWCLRTFLVLLTSLRLLCVPFPAHPLYLIGAKGQQFAFIVSLYHCYRIASRLAHSAGGVGGISIAQALEIPQAAALAVRLPLRSKSGQLLHNAALLHTVEAAALEPT